MLYLNFTLQFNTDSTQVTDEVSNFNGFNVTVYEPKKFPNWENLLKFIVLDNQFSWPLCATTVTGSFNFGLTMMRR